ncbi:hypothetical protein A5699_05740 [Mycobacterium sp. E802]|uniref:TRAFAC clade GTPase domain-containing protein n=1 Tax=Mycobacterium sp. E802 TaxID=1834152 RepID=UPI000800B8FC|nr:hypothetical protein [Mycobacterium sp. E802]OBG82652.1 hypothetical protein A5699_05740 [Mycobacterium sp. E802]
MDEVGGFLLVAAIVVSVVVFVLWVVLAILMRILAILVIYWTGAFAVGLLVGILGGLAIPIRVLRGHAKVQPLIATPQAVVANKVMATKARGAAKNFGWDHAWPVYNPYQAKNDARAVAAETRLIVTSVWAAVSPSHWNIGKGGASSALQKRGLVAKAKKALTNLPGAAWLTFAAVPVAGAFLGVWISIVFWLAAMAVFGGAVYVGQQAWVIGYRWLDRLRRKKDRASLRCTKCYRETTMPSYECPNRNCAVIHRDISPGPLGLMHRRCECGTGFPTTVSAAAKKLQAVCPYCGEGVAEGSATRRTIQLPTIGAIAAGKTRFLAAAATALSQGLAEQGGSFTPLSAPAGSFHQLAHNLMATGQSTAKTQLDDNPEALPYKLETGSRQLELHFIDAAGESFRSMDSTQSLGYIDTADVLLLILDPLGLPGIYDEATRAGVTQRLQIATADQEDAYASAIDRLRAENVKLKQRHLGVVITKLDVLQNLPAGAGMTPGDSLGIRQWLISVGQDGLVRRLEDDFEENISYFGVDLMRPSALTEPTHPIHVCQWVLDTANAKIVVNPALAAMAVETA